LKSPFSIQKILRESPLHPLDREAVLSFVLKKPREYLFAHPEKVLSVLEVREFKQLVTRRKKGEPVACITGKKEFFGLDFFVNKNVLIPRPETELLVESVLQKIQDTKYKIQNTIIDLGTGSGNIVVSLVKNIPAPKRKKMKFFAVDISPKALDIARKNARRHNVGKYIKFAKSDLLGYFLKKKTDLTSNLLIVANLPYVSEKIYQKNKNNLKFEPKIALTGKKNGLEHYMRLFSEIREIFDSHCSMFHVMCYVEFSPEQKNTLAKIIRKELPSAEFSFAKDLARRWRMAKIVLSR
jgi:release factor glutamine methyltransferase